MYQSGNKHVNTIKKNAPSVNNQFDALFSMYLFHFSTCFVQPSAHQEGTPDRHTKQSPMQSDIYQLMY